MIQQLLTTIRPVQPQLLSAPGIADRQRVHCN
jgi:hypothetical protein